jgi:hypothetical protein
VVNEAAEAVESLDRTARATLSTVTPVSEALDRKRDMATDPTNEIDDLDPDHEDAGDADIPDFRRRCRAFGSSAGLAFAARCRVGSGRSSADPVARLEAWQRTSR